MDDFEKKNELENGSAAEPTPDTAHEKETAPVLQDSPEETSEPADAGLNAEESDGAQSENGSQKANEESSAEAVSDENSAPVPAPVFESEAQPEVSPESDGEKPKKKKKKTALIVSLAVMLAVIVAGLCAIVWFTQGPSSSSVKSDETVMTIGDDKYTAGEFYFYYLNYYSYYYQYIQYGSISADSIRDGAIKEMAYVNTVYNDAQKDGITLSESEYKEYVTDSIDSLSAQAETDGLTMAEYLEKYYGKGFSEDMLKSILEKNAVANIYKERKTDEAKEYYTSDEGVAEILKEYNDNRKDYDLVGVEYYYFSDDTDGTKASDKAQKLIDAVNNGQTFANAVYDNFKGEDYKYSRDECPSIPNASYDNLSSLSDDVASWAFEIDSNGNYVRKAGDMKSFEANSMTYVFRISSVPAKVETHPVTYRDILISASGTDEESLMSAKSEANAIYTEYKAHADEKGYDAEYFGTLAADKSADSTTSSNGGLHENVYLPDSASDKWALESGRKQGDIAVLKGDDGYHVVLFDSMSSSPEWMSSITSVLTDKKVEDLFTGAENASADAVKDDAVIEKVVASAQNTFSTLNSQAQQDAQNQQAQAQDQQAQDGNS